MPGDNLNDEWPVDPLPNAVAGANLPPVGRPGFSTAEKVVGVAAAYEHPLIASVAASAMLRNENDPTRRGQLETLRKGSLTWLAVSAGIAVVVLIIALIAFSSADGSGSCKGGPDRFDAMGITYQSNGGNQWTVTYPCNGGGSTTRPIARDKVPGQG